MNNLEDKILYLMGKGNWKVKELSQLLDRSPGCIRGMLCIMKKKGLVEVSVDLSSDCRSKTFILTNSI